MKPYFFNLYLKVIKLIMNSLLPKFFESCLRGLGQIMLQNNPITGLLFLIGIFVGSVPMGFAALLSVVVGTLTAKILKFNSQETEAGLYGFSAALVGVALLIFLKNEWVAWLLMVVGNFFSAWIQNFFNQRKISVYTLPFVLVTWGILFFCNHFLPELISVTTTTSVEKLDFYSFILRDFGQVIFQNHLGAGALFLLGIVVNSPKSAVYSLVFSTVAAVLSWKFFSNTIDFQQGLLGYNVVLCIIALMNDKKWNFAWIAFSTVISMLISYIFIQFQWIPLTFPFVLSTVFSLKIKEFFSLKTENYS